MNNSHNCFNIIVLKISVLFDLSWYATFHCRVFILNILNVQTWLIVHTYFILFECLINKYTYTYYVWFFITVIFEISVLHLFQMIPNAFSLILNALSLIPNIMPCSKWNSINVKCIFLNLNSPLHWRHFCLQIEVFEYFGGIDFSKFVCLSIKLHVFMLYCSWYAFIVLLIKALHNCHTLLSWYFESVIDDLISIVPFYVCAPILTIVCWYWIFICFLMVCMTEMGFNLSVCLLFVYI